MMNIRKFFEVFAFAVVSLFSLSSSAAVYMGSWDVDGTGTLKDVYNETSQLRVTDNKGNSYYYSMSASGWSFLGAEDLDGIAGVELVFSVVANNVSSVRVITHKNRNLRDYDVRYASSWSKIAIADLDGKPGKEVLLNVVGTNLHEYRVLHFSNYSESVYPYNNTSAVILTGGVVDTDGKAGAEIIVNTGGYLNVIHDSTRTTKAYYVGSDYWTVFGFSDLDGIAGNEIVLGHGENIDVINDYNGGIKKINIGGYFTFNSFQNSDGKGGNEILIRKNNAIQTVFYYVPSSTGGGTSTPGQEFLLQHLSGMCIHPKGGSASTVGTPLIFFPSCTSEARLKFKFLDNKSLQNVGSGSCVHPEGGSENPAVGTRLVFWDSCSDGLLANRLGNKRLGFELTANGSIRHINSGLCVHPRGGSATPAQDTELVLWNTCDEPKSIFKKL
ncbi:MAG TPA: RICIN domain-containing protein [Cellvibrio sp.]|nr:RICIN domain-containing protein [Cellvibrio sp.]